MHSMGRLVDTIMQQVAEGVDRAFLRVSFQSRRAGRRAARTSVLDHLDRAAAFYDEAEREGRLFPPVERPRWQERRVRRLRGGGTVVDLSWRSGYSALDPSHAETLSRCPENEIAHARWYRHPHPAPALVCLHGWGAGQFLVEERAYPASWLYGLGLDVIFATLPFHARASRRRASCPCSLRRTPSGPWRGSPKRFSTCAPSSQDFVRRVRPRSG
jgi:hypothetical protein